MASEVGLGLVLAAGKGTRMKSARPKVLHELAGRPMLEWVTRALKEAGLEKLGLVVSEEAGDEAIPVDRYGHDFAVLQTKRRGTGDAVAAAAPAISQVSAPPFAAGRLVHGSPVAASYVLVCAGDTPAVRPQTLARFVKECRASGCGLGVLGMRPSDPTGYGRLVTEGRQLGKIVEEKDATEDEKRIGVCNTGIVFARCETLFSLLGEITADNAQGEYYLTDCFELAAGRGDPAFVSVADDARDFAGVNNRAQLAAVEDWLVEQLRQNHMKAGVTFRAPATTYVEAGVSIAEDVEIGPQCSLTGDTQIGSGSVLDAGVRAGRSTIGACCRVGAHAVLEGVTVSDGEVVPPASVRQDVRAKPSG